MTADDVVHAEHAAAICDQRRLRADLVREQQAGHVRGGADAAVALRRLRAVGLHVAHELLEIGGRHGLARDDHGGRVEHQTDRLEVRQ